MNNKIGNNVMDVSGNIYENIIASILLQTIKDLVYVYEGGKILNDDAQSIESWLRFAYNSGLITTNPEYIIRKCKTMAGV